ncbi:hypothetical protein D9758_008952 [Tetrapyrgos nigripes]|uniref:Cytochrome P450 n=1 Tax=Tetrapyrgos nigripes TaxID=182062 RepID=A0A8H5LRD1_9AGAR|nr:hypothetical protein D9758_008952 [Tetrapyrgos nigripes]
MHDYLWMCLWHLYCLFKLISKEGTALWDDPAQCFTLDAIGSSVLGHNFKAIETDNLFLKEYNQVMAKIAAPLYLLFPWMERLVLWKQLICCIDNLTSKFIDLLEHKRDNPGDDMMTYMLKDPGMTFNKLRDNMIVLFLSRHVSNISDAIVTTLNSNKFQDTTAGSILTLFYFLVCHPEIQQQVRDEVKWVFGDDQNPTVDLISGISLPYLTTCIREALRINTAISYIFPQKSPQPVHLGKYTIPTETSLIMNISAIHHRQDAWKSPHDFDPDRFLDPQWSKSSWLPFALGPRQCPAQNFAMYKQHILASHVSVGIQMGTTSQFHSSQWNPEFLFTFCFDSSP